MARVKRGVTAGARHKKVLKKAKGYYNGRRKIYRAAKQAVIAEIVRDHRFAVLGDEQLHQRVGEAFWAGIRDLMIGHFKEDRFVEGLTEGIALIGEQLREHFPHRADDVNELSDEISY